MVSVLNPYGSASAGVSTLLNTAQGLNKPGEFKPKSTATLNIQSTLDNVKADANQRLIYSSALNRLEGIRLGIIEPSQEWETVAGYLMMTGQPFKLTTGEDGGLKALSQNDGELDGYNDAQKKQIQAAIDAFKQYTDGADLVDQKEELRNKLDYASFRIYELRQFAPAEAQWERDLQLYQGLGQPAKVALNDEGELTVVNQLEHDFSDVENENERLKLVAARNELQNILDGTSSATESWQYTALGAIDEGEDYFLDLDSSGNVEVKSNAARSLSSGYPSGRNITPDFLQASDDDIPDRTEQWQDEALALYRAQKPFYFDFDASGQNIKVREVNLNNTLELHKVQSADDKILQARLSILA